MRNACHKQSPHSGCRAVGAPGRQELQAAQMRAPLCLLLLLAHAVDMLALHRRKKQELLQLENPGPIPVSSEEGLCQVHRCGWQVSHGGTLKPCTPPAGTGLGGNCTGCVICSEENGCSTCQQRLFLFIRREGIRQYGKCVHDCPLGFFGIRGQEANRCKKCGSTCESCFSQDFCIRCKRRFHLYKGKCLPTCPPGTLTHQSTRECQEECEPSPWGNWSPCIHNGKTCGSGWGLETRVREAGPAKQEETASCRVLSESRKCPIKRPCPGERNPRQKSRKDRKDRRQRKDRKLERRPQLPASQ